MRGTMLREHCCGQAARREATRVSLDTRASRSDRLLRSPHIFIYFSFPHTFPPPLQLVAGTL